jgi:signal transduction histidine kinase
VTGLIVLAFIVPLAMLVDQLAEERAMASAERQAAAVAAVLAGSTDPATVQRAIVSIDGAHPDRIAVHGLAKRIGSSRAPAKDLGATGVVSVPDGVVRLLKVDLGEDRAAVIEVFVPDDELSRGVARAWWTLTLVGLLLIGVSLFAGDRLMTRTVGSARSLAVAARAIGNGAVHARVPATGPRELTEAGVAFNSMADQISAHLNAERELFADRSHRLRTPLTALRLEAERLRSQGAHRLAQAVEAMEREVDYVIQTSRRSAQASAPEPPQCDAGEVVRERMAFWSAVADDQGRPFQVLGAERTAPVPLPRSELVAAVDALLGNVFRYTPQGTPFEVAVSRRDGYVSVRVDDAGSGITHPDRAMRRGTSDRGSTGLGLDIVRRAALSGQGGVDIDRSRLGGTSVVVLLADADPPAKSRQLWGFVGRLSREPEERRWGRHARAARTL